MKDTIIELAECFGWEFINQEKNPLMYSFIKNDIRCNIYHTTMTVTIQRLGFNCKTHRKCDLQMIEKILTENE